MKGILTIVLVASVAAFATQIVRAQSYGISTYKIGGGGGAGTGGQFALSGTIGVHDAGPFGTGGNYALAGGFWNTISIIQTAGSPMLTISTSNNSVVVSWPAPATGFALQQNSDLTATNWTVSGFSVSTNGAIQNITISSPVGNMFFRLIHQ